MEKRNRVLWDQKAKDWDLQVGNKGDPNRQFNSDPFLWHFLGQIPDQVIIDAGCGTGYLSRQLQIKGAKVIGIDFSVKMIKVAKSLCLDKPSPLNDHKKEDDHLIHPIQFRVDSCSSLTTIEDSSIE